METCHPLTMNIPPPRYRAAATRTRLTAPTQTQMTFDTLVAAESEMSGLHGLTTSCSKFVDMELKMELTVLKIEHHVLSDGNVTVRS